MAESMDISTLSATARTSRSDSRNTTQTGAEAAALAFQKADKRIQQQREAVSVELSSLGKLSSAFSEARTASRALGEIKQTTPDASVAKAAKGFIKAFNLAAQTARSATAKRGLLTETGLARAAESDLRQAVSADTTATDLKKIGITRQTDGTLVLDAKKFEAALAANPGEVRSTLAKVGQRTDQVTTRELASGGNIGGAVSSLDNRARSLETRQAEQQAQAAAAQQAISAQSANLDNSLNSGAAAYQRIFSL